MLTIRERELFVHSLLFCLLASLQISSTFSHLLVSVFTRIQRTWPVLLRLDFMAKSQILMDWSWGHYSLPPHQCPVKFCLPGELEGHFKMGTWNISLFLPYEVIKIMHADWANDQLHQTKQPPTSFNTLHQGHQNISNTLIRQQRNLWSSSYWNSSLHSDGSLLVTPIFSSTKSLLLSPNPGTVIIKCQSECCKIKSSSHLLQPGSLQVFSMARPCSASPSTNSTRQCISHASHSQNSRVIPKCYYFLKKYLDSKKLEYMNTCICSFVHIFRNSDFTVVM